MSNKDLKEKVRTAIFISDAIEKAFNFLKLIDETSEGLDELEKEFNFIYHIYCYHWKNI